MARKWKRMVEKNTKDLNQKRKKTGRPQLSNSEDGYVTFKGRSIVLPSLLLGVAVLFFLSYSRVAEKDGMFWFTISMYALLAVFYYFRRPYLNVARNYISTRRMGREIFLKPSEIEAITVSKTNISIALKGKKSKWGFSATWNLYPIEQMDGALKEFAAKNSIAYVNETVSGT
ncbi:hypothetical protein [Marinicrinis lubricantis]|uniref:PH domain-containing protein n=1 Tax=Marinicrinis lubricantis TaxID=2086470 RepID=A0ABW1ITP5_9BACL